VIAFQDNKVLLQQNLKKRKACQVSDNYQQLKVIDISWKGQERQGVFCSDLMCQKLASSLKSTSKKSSSIKRSKSYTPRVPSFEYGQLWTGNFCP
jgi:hypothetical protein